MRGIAALIVALYHLGIGVEYVSPIRNGYLFVDLFFVLSGFIMCAAYGSRLRSGEDVRVFMIRRIGRLVPLLIFSTLAFVLAANLIVLLKRMATEFGYASLLRNPNALEWLIPNAAEIISTVTLTFSMGVFDDLILNTPSWSISVEFYAYVLFALLCLWLTGSRRLLAFSTAGVIGLVVTVWASVSVHDCLRLEGCMSLTYDFGFARAVYSFFLGTLAYYASRKMRTGYVSMQLAALAMLTLVFGIVDSSPGIAFILPLVFALLVLSVCTDAGPIARFLKPRPFQLLGLWSYSIYLMHMPLLLFFESLSTRLNGSGASAITLVTYVTMLLVISAWTYRHIEDPLRGWFNKLASRQIPRASRAHL